MNSGLQLPVNAMGLAGIVTTIREKMLTGYLPMILTE
jgi:hypothetical protein